MNFFKNKTVLITGAAHGVGKSLAIHLKQTAGRLILVDLDSIALNQLIETNNFPDTCFLYTVDLSKIDKIESTINEIISKFTIDIFINNAGVSVIAPLENQPREDIEWIININLVSAMEISRLVLPGMKRNKSGHLVFVGSAAGIQGFPNKTSYSASKFGLRGFAEALQAEVAPFGIHVTSVFPGPVKTNMLDRSRINQMEEKEKIQKYLFEKGDPPDRVASKILKGIINRKSVVLISGQSKILWFFKRLMPVSFAKLIGRYQEKLPA